MFNFFKRKQPQIIPDFDLQYIRGATNNDPEAMAEILETIANLIAQEGHEPLAAIREVGVTEDLRKTVHKLKSGLSNLGYQELTDLLTDTEAAILETDDPKKIEQMLTQATAMIEACKQPVNALIEKYRP